MRVAFILGSFPVLSETFILNQITGLIDRGHAVDIYARGRRTVDTVHAEVEKYRLLDRTYYLNNQASARMTRALRSVRFVLSDPDLGFYAKVNAFTHARRYHRILKSIPYSGLLQFSLNQLRDGPYDVIHCQYGTLGRLFIHLKIAGAIDSKFITSFRGHDVTQECYATPGFYDELFKHGDIFLPVSQDLKSRLIALGCDESKITVLHSGIDCSKFDYIERHATPHNPTILLTIARLVEMKGVSYGIHAAASLIRSGKDIRYIIVGDGPLKEELSRLIHDLQMENHIVLLGWQNHDTVMQLLRQANILLAPSVTAGNGEAEGIPNAVKEAMATGIPIVSTFHSGIPELVNDGHSGFLVQERDTERLSERLAYLIDHPELWPGMGQAGRTKVEQDFDINRLNDRLAGLYSGQGS